MNQVILFPQTHNQGGSVRAIRSTRPCMSKHIKNDVRPDNWSKFWWKDWQNDADLQLCSYAARGLWIAMLALMHGAEVEGYLLVHGRKMTMPELAKLTAGSEREVTKLLLELAAKGVYSLTEQGVIYSRRMVRDAEAREKARRVGKLGGNPALKPNGPGDDNPPPKGQHKSGVNPKDNGGVGNGISLEAEAEAEEERKGVLTHSMRDARERDFAEFWLAYPRKVGKDIARRSWQSALKRASVAEILAGLHRAKWAHEARFVPHPATWLNQGRWQDDPNAAVPGEPGESDAHAAWRELGEAMHARGLT